MRRVARKAGDLRVLAKRFMIDVLVFMFLDCWEEEGEERKKVDDVFDVVRDVGKEEKKVRCGAASFLSRQTLKEDLLKDFRSLVLPLPSSGLSRQKAVGRYQILVRTLQTRHAQIRKQLNYLVRIQSKLGLL